MSAKLQLAIARIAVWLLRGRARAGESVRPNHKIEIWCASNGYYNVRYSKFEGPVGSGSRAAWSFEEASLTAALERLAVLI